MIGVIRNNEPSKNASKSTFRGLPGTRFSPKVRLVRVPNFWPYDMLKCSPYFNAVRFGIFKYVWIVGSSASGSENSAKLVFSEKY